MDLAARHTVEHLALLLVLCLSADCAAEQPRLTRDELLQRRQQAGNDPVRLLELCPLVEAADADELRRKAAELIAVAPAARQEELASKIAPLLASAALGPGEVRQLLGTPTRIARQMVYRRHVEQWVYDDPLPLCVVWQASRGHDVRILTVHPLTRKNR